MKDGISKFGEKLKDIRNMRSLTQKDLATEVGVDQRVIRMYESGRMSPKEDKLEQLADSLSVDIDTMRNVPISNDSKETFIQLLITMNDLWPGCLEAMDVNVIANTASIQSDTFKQFLEEDGELFFKAMALYEAGDGTIENIDISFDEWKYDSTKRQIVYKIIKSL